MKRYVLINASGTVDNVVMWDGDSESWTPPEGYTAVLSDAAGIGWAYGNGVFTEPAPTSAPPLTAEQTNAVIKAQLADLDAQSVRALHEAVLALAASGTALPADMTKRLHDMETQKNELRAKLV